MMKSGSPRTARSVDPRIRFTREVLGDALVALMHEWPFERITVQDILDRAGVGRTTFYTHYADKEDLFLSDVEEFMDGMAGYLDRCQAPAQRLAPVEELFGHIADMNTFYKALNASGKLAVVQELGIGFFARSIEQRLALTLVDMPSSKLRVTSQALAGALFALLDGWMFEAGKFTPKAADDLFHRLAWNGVRPQGPQPDSKS